MPSVSSSFPECFAGGQVGTKVSLGNYFTLKVLCIPSSAKCSLSMWRQTEDGVHCNKDTWVAVFWLIKHFAKETFRLFPVRNLIRCKRSSGARILTCRPEFLLTLVCLLFRTQSISSFCVPMSSDLLLNGRVQTLWEKEDLKALSSPRGACICKIRAQLCGARETGIISWGRAVLDQAGVRI